MSFGKSEILSSELAILLSSITVSKRFRAYKVLEDLQWSQPQEAPALSNRRLAEAYMLANDSDSVCLILNRLRATAEDQCFVSICLHPKPTLSEQKHKYFFKLG